jgi:hypothetical protein
MIPTELTYNDMQNDSLAVACFEEIYQQDELQLIEKPY